MPESDSPRVLYTSALLVDRLFHRDVGKLVVCEGGVLPRDVCCGGEDAAQQVGFQDVWDRLREMCGTVESGRGQFTLVVGELPPATVRVSFADDPRSGRVIEAELGHATGG